MTFVEAEMLLREKVGSVGLETFLHRCRNGFMQRRGGGAVNALASRSKSKEG